MLARLGIEIILFLLLAVGLWRLFIRALESPRLSRLIKRSSPPPESDDEILEAFQTADSVAEQQAQRAEDEAVAKIKSAAKLKSRRASK